MPSDSLAGVYIFTLLPSVCAVQYGMLDVRVYSTAHQSTVPQVGQYRSQDSREASEREI